MEKNFRDLRWDSFLGALALGVGLLLVMGLVPLIFKLFPREIAGLVAGVVFLITAAACIHASQFEPKHLPLQISAMVFLFGFAVPILVFRLAFWGMDFNEISVGVVTGRALHSTSTFVFLAMTAAAWHRAWSFYKSK
jgi:hypothetical protein